MKRLCSFLIITVLAAGAVSAQSRFEQQNETNRQRETGPAQNKDNKQRESRPAQNRDNKQRELTTVTVEGTLQLEKGFIALASGDNVYFVPMLMRYAGFIEGIKEGAKVSVEGYQFRNMLHPKKVTVNGKNYDFPQAPAREIGPGRNGPNKNDFRKDGQRQGNFRKHGHGHGHKHGQKHGHKHGNSHGRGKQQQERDRGHGRSRNHR